MHNIHLAIQYALNGLRITFKNERNFKIEVFCAFATILMAIILRVTQTSWLIIILNISFVLTAELFNTAIEKVADVVCKEFNPVIKVIKDVAAAGVMIAVLSSLVSGLVIFIPFILRFY